MSRSRREAYAVCPRDPSAMRPPELFPTRRGAMRFLNSEVLPGLEAHEAGSKGLKGKERRNLRKEELQRLRETRVVVGTQITKGEFPRSAYSSIAPNYNREYYQDPAVPIRWAEDYCGLKCQRTFRDFLPASDLGPMDPLTLTEEFQRGLDGPYDPVTCYLGEDWEFGKIEDPANPRPGHEFQGRSHDSIGEIVLGAIYDLEDAFLHLHPNAPCEQVRDFWGSWQVRRHIAGFCARMVPSPSVKKLAEPERPSVAVEKVRVRLSRQIAAFAHSLSGSQPRAKTGTHAGGVSPQFPHRAKWLQDILDERRWDKHDLRRFNGPEHRTTQKILNGQPVQEGVLGRVIAALNSFRRSGISPPPLTESDIPND